MVQQLQAEDVGHHADVGGRVTQRLEDLAHALLGPERQRDPDLIGVSAFDVGRKLVDASDSRHAGDLADALDRPVIEIADHAQPGPARLAQPADDADAEFTGHDHDHPARVVTAAAQAAQHLAQAAAQQCQQAAAEHEPQHQPEARKRRLVAARGEGQRTDRDQEGQAPGPQQRAQLAVQGFATPGPVDAAATEDADADQQRDDHRPLERTRHHGSIEAQHEGQPAGHGNCKPVERAQHRFDNHRMFLKNALHES